MTHNNPYVATLIEMGVLIGYKLVAQSEEKPQGTPARTVVGLTTAFLRAVLGLPMHFVRETGHSMLPMLIATIPVVISG